MDINPISRTVRIRNLKKAPVVVYTQEEISSIFGYMEAHYSDALTQIKFLLLTGFRETESCNLRWDKIDHELRAIHHYNEKSKRDELYPCTDILWDLLTNQSKEYDPFVFRYRKRFGVYEALRQTKKKLKITKRLHIHTLKKNYSSAISAAGTPPAFIPSLTHHSTMQVMKDSYLFIELEEKRKWLEKAHILLNDLAKKSQNSEKGDKIVGRIENTKAQ